LLGALPPGLRAQVAVLNGVVHDTAGAPLEGADVLIGQRRATSDVRGRFRLDSLVAGRQQIVIRRLGYLPLRTSIELPAGTSSFAFRLEPAPVELPPLVVEVRRRGIYGVVTLEGTRPAAGARVRAMGARGGEVRTDSAGRFAFPDADNGAYLVLISHPGYRDRTLSFELPRGEGRELAIGLAPGDGGESRADAQAFQDLRLRLAAGFRRERFTAAGLERFGSDQLCQMPIRAGMNPLIVVNGVNVYRNMPRSFLCFWRADEVELLEFGLNRCREPSGTLRLLAPGCGGYVVIWERR
jgi:hypothetical protein